MLGDGRMSCLRQACWWATDGVARFGVPACSCTAKSKSNELKCVRPAAANRGDRKVGLNVAMPEWLRQAERGTSGIT